MPDRIGDSVPKCRWPALPRSGKFGVCGALFSCFGPRHVERLFPPKPVHGCLTAFVGFASSLPWFCRVKGCRRHGLRGGLGQMALSVAMGLCAIVLSAWTKLPCRLPGRTPGARCWRVPCRRGRVSGRGGRVSGLRPSDRRGRSVQAARPRCRRHSCAACQCHALGRDHCLCFAPFKATPSTRHSALPILVAWAVVAAFKRLYAVPAALLAFIGVMVFGVGLPEGALASCRSRWPPVEFVMPAFTLHAVVSIAPCRSSSSPWPRRIFRHCGAQGQWV